MLYWPWLSRYGGLAMEFEIQAEDTATEDIRSSIVHPLVAYNERQAGSTGYRPLVLSIRNPDGEVVGGLYGHTSFGWLFVELLFVPESLRGRGIGRNLMLRAESEAIARGCRGAWLDTFQFQARGFYERLGYSCFGRLDDYPAGHSRFFMRKPLGGASSRSAIADIP